MINEQEFETLFDKKYVALRNYIFYRTLNTELAEDIAQDVFLVIWEKRKFLSNDRIYGLLYKIANDLIISNHRKKLNLQNYIEEILTYKVDYSSNKELLESEELLEFEVFKKKLAQAISELSKREREIFLLSRCENLKYKEIALKLGLSVKSVERYISIALTLLKKKLLK